MERIKKYIREIGETKDISKMEKLGDMLANLIYDLKYSHKEMYEEKINCLYELAHGKTLTDEKAFEWVREMKPRGEHWTIEETTTAESKMGYNVEPIKFYTVANMMYNDYYNVVKDNEELALKLAHDWIHDEDAVEDKLYEYWKNIAKRD